MERRAARHQTRLSGAHTAAADTEFQPGQRVRTIDGLIGRILEVSESWAPGNTSYQVVLDNGMGGGTYLGSQLRPIPQDYGGLHPTPANLPASLGSADGEPPSGENVHTAAEDYPEMGTVLHDHPDPAAQITVVGARQAAAIEGHGMDPFAMAMSGLSGEDAEDMRAVIEHIRQRKGPGVPIDAKDAELLTRSFHGRDRMEQAGYQLSAHSRDMKFPRGFGIDIHHNHRLHLVPERHGDETNWYARIVHAPHPMGPRIEHTIRTSDEDLPSAVQTFLDHPDIQAEMEHQRTEGKAIHEQIRREGASEEGPFYHGSKYQFQPGDYLRVQDTRPPNYSESTGRHLFFTTDRRVATNYAEPRHDSRTEVGHVYEVRPTSRYHQDPAESVGYSRDPSAYRTDRRLQVIRELGHEDLGDELWGRLRFNENHPNWVEHYGAGGSYHWCDNCTPGGARGVPYEQAHPWEGKSHTAATYADGADARDDNYNGDPDIGIYWQAPAQQQWLADEGLDAADEAPGLDDSLEWPDEQQLAAEGARQVQIQRRPQKRQQEEEQPWWPEEGRSPKGEVMHSAEDFLSRVERELPGDGEDEEDEEENREDEDHHTAAHGDAPQHGREPRAGHPGSYDAASTEGQGDPAWDSSHPVPDAEVDQHFFDPGDPDDPHRTQVRYITVTSVTINDTEVSGAGDAPDHGLIPRAGNPESYDAASAEGTGDDIWSTPVSLPGKSKQQLKREDNGATIGMYPGGVEAGEGPGLSIGAIATKGHALPPGDELGHMQAAHGHDAGWAEFMAKHLTPEQIEVTHNLEHSGRNDPHDREEDWLAAGDASGYHEFIARMAAANGWQPGDERDIDIYRAQQAGQPPSRTYRDEMSDRWHEFRNRSQPDVIHRGIWADDVPPEVHDLIHDPAQPREDRAHALLSWLTRASDPVYGGHDPALGQHWTPHIDIAHRSILNQAPESDVPGAGHSADVIFHAKMPGARNEIRDEKQRAAQEVGYGYSPDEHEVFLREGTPLRLTGVSWREHEPEYPMEPYEHHDFDRPVRHEAKVPWTEHQRGQLHAWQDGGPGLAPGDFVPSGDFTNKRPTSWATGPEPEGGEGPGEVNEPIRVQAASEGAWEDHLRERHGWDENDIAEAGEHQGVRRLHDFLHELGIADHSHGAGEMTPARRQEMHKRELGERFGLPPRLSPHMRLLQPERGGVPSPDPAHSMMESVPAEVADPEELAEPVRRAYYSSLHAQIALQAAADAVREQDAAAEPWDWPIARAAIEELGVPLTQGSPKRRTARKHLLKMFRKAASSPAFRFEFTAAWRDVVAKAKRIRASGGVRITAVKGSIVIGQVRGDHDVYESGLQRYPGRVASIFAWSCGCPWASFHQDKDLGTRYAGRPCSHVYALQLEAGARTRFGRKPLQPDPALDLPYSEVVVKSLPPWGPGGWQQTWTAPATLVPVTSLKKAAERYVRPAKVSEMMQHLQHHHGIDPRTLQNADPERMWHFHGLEHDENPSLSHQHTEPEGIPGEQRWPALFTEPDYAVDEYGGVPVEQRHELGEPGRTAPFAPWKYSLNSLVPVQHVATPDEARDWDWPPEARDEWERQHMAPAMRAARLLEALGEPREDIETLARVAGIVHLEQAAHLENPHTRGHEWYHGTQAHKEDLARGFADPAEIASSAYEMPEGEGDDPGHWNRLLGTHFAADHAVADEFAQGEHQGSSNEGYGWDWDDPEEHQGIVHARLGIHNPKHYASEHDMDHEAYEHEFAAGNHPINHLQDYGEDEDEANEIREEMWPHAMRIHRDYGTEKIPESTYGHYLSPFERHPMRTAWLNTHPDKWNIADRFKKRLMDQGHDGITYGNEYEKSRYGRAGNTSAIAFHPHQIEVTQHHHVDEDCHHTAARERPDVEIPGYEGSIGPSPAQYNQTHVYARDVTSGAGNCVCGRARDDDHMHFEVTAATNWDRSYSEIPEEIHRGLYAPESHRVFGLPSSDEDIAHMLIAAHQEEHYPYDRDRDHKFGTHWTADENVARNFAHEHEREHHADDQCPDHDEHFDAVPVVFHAQRPERHEIEDDPRRLGWQNVDDYDTPEQEVTIRHGAPVRLTGVSWQQHTSFGPVWHRHDLREPRTLRAEDRDSPDDPNQWNASLHQAAANDPWGDDNTMLEVPPKPYGATSPPERDTDPGSYGPLAGPDPENWGEIQECLAPGTRLLTKDLRWQPIELLEPGDELIAFDEEQRPGARGRKFRTTRVVATKKIVKACIRITGSDGTVVIASADHFWLGDSGKNMRWIPAARLREGTTKIISIGCWEEEDSKEAGWLAGMYDGEGWVSGNPESTRGKTRPLGVAQSEGPVADHLRRALKERGFRFDDYGRSAGSPEHWKDCRRMQILGGLSEQLRLLGIIRPERLVARAERLWENRQVKSIKSAMVLSVEFIGDHEVIALQTEAKTFIAEGWLSHNSSVIQQPLSTDAALAFSLEGPDTGDWVPERQEGFPYSDQAATAGPSTSIEPRDPQGIRMEEAWRRDSHEEIARHITEEHHDLAESLAQAYPGEGPDAWDDRSIGERGLSFAHGADHYERALGRRPDSLSHDHDRDGNVIRRDEFRSAPSAYIAPPRSKPELMDHINTEHGITYSGSGEPADRFLIELHHKFHDGVMPDRRTRDHQHEFPEDHPIDPVFGMLWPIEAAGTASPHDRAAPQLDGAIAEMKDEPEPALDPEGLTADGNPPVGGGNASATDKASLATWAAAEDPYRPADLEEHYRTHHSWKGGLEVLTRQGIDPAEYHRLMHRTPGEYFTVPHEHFGMSEDDQAALREIGIEAAQRPADPDEQAGAHVPVPGDYPLEGAATGGGPGMSRHDEVLSPADVSIQSMGTQQWSGGDYNSADEAAPELEHHDSVDNIVAAFQRSAVGRRLGSDGPGAAQGPSDTDVAAAARAYLSKTADVLPEAEASALIAEGRGERARNLDLLDLKGTHYAEEIAELERRGLNIDDFEDDIVTGA